MYDYLVVGSGLYGATFAQQAKAHGKSVLVIDKRPNVAGNIYTEKVEGMWKNLKADYLGLAHYRRHFCLRKKKAENGEESKWKSILNSKEAQILCKQYDVIVPEKRHYVIETLESHYAHTHYFSNITSLVVSKSF